MQVYRVGSRESIVGSFFRDGSPFQPTTVTCTVTKPDASSVTYSQAAGDFIHDTTHEYLLDVTLDQRGVWWFAWLGIGAWTDGGGNPRIYRESFVQTVRALIPTTAPLT